MKSLQEAKSEFLRIVSDLQMQGEAESFMLWLKNEAYEEILSNTNANEHQNRIEKRLHLAQIAEYSKTLQPNFEGVCPSETIKAPENSEEGLNFQNTAQVDAFLYDEADVEEMTQSGRIPTHFCENCGNRQKIREIELITHSCGRDDLEFIFDALLPDLTGKNVLDIGSRIGAVCFGAFVYSQSSAIIGVEMNSELCNLAQNTINQFGMQNRIKIVNAELSTRLDLLQSADVVVLNNVFDWFVPIEIQVNLWQIIFKNVKSGSLLVTIPSLEEALGKLPKNAEIDLRKWVRPMLPYRSNKLPRSEIEEKCETIKLYQVQ